MQSPFAPGVNLSAGGVPVSGVHYFRAASLVPAVEAGFQAGAGGVAIGRFGWAGADGVVLNARLSAAQAQGVVATQGGDWRAVFWDEATSAWRIRQGMGLTMLAGAFGVWVHIPGGAVYGARIYANPVDGAMVAAYSVGLETTRWSVARVGGPYGLYFITTWNSP